MGQNSNIQWTDDTDNVIVVVDENGKFNGWYCYRYSPGCDNCYAASINKAGLFGGNGLDYKVPTSGQFPPLGLRREILEKWKRQGRPRKHFVNSMTDTFGEFVPEEWIYEILDAAYQAPKQTFQILTKRAKRMCSVTLRWLQLRGLDRVPSNIWLGVSVENQEWADKRIPWLFKIPAVRFLSCEPLLGAVDLSNYLQLTDQNAYLDPEDGGKGWGYDEYSGGFRSDNGRFDPYDPQPGIHWAIIGGESGQGARPFNLEWATRIIGDCKLTDTPAFMKQVGSKPMLNGRTFYCLDRKGGSIEEWPEKLRVREFPNGKMVADTGL